jgi:hypothetical protein
MDREYAFVRAIAGTKEFQSIMSVLFARWSDDAFAHTADLLMEQYSLQCIEIGFRSIAAYPHGTRRTRPAFITACATGCGRLEYTAVINTGACAIEVVEAGKYGMAEASAQYDTGAEAEDTALQH